MRGMLLLLMMLSGPAVGASPGLAARLDLLETRLAALEGGGCAGKFPDLAEGSRFRYAGCNRNVHRNTTVSVETCQDGVITVYNTSSTRRTGLFDLQVAANLSSHDVWHFVCTLTTDSPHQATCTLTFESPLRPEGPAWLRVNFDVQPGPGGQCRPARASVVGTYFYDALTNDAGVYSFYLTPLASGAGSPAGSERAALEELARATGVAGWKRRGGWLDPGRAVCDWELVGCDAAGRVKLLTLDFNNLTGTLPPSLGMLTGLEDLDLEGNHLSGELPAELGKLSSLVQLGLGGGNRFGGRLPAELCPVFEKIVSAGGHPACDLSGLGFRCELPCAQAAACGANCTA